MSRVLYCYCFTGLAKLYTNKQKKKKKQEEATILIAFESNQETKEQQVNIDTLCPEQLRNLCKKQVAVIEKLNEIVKEKERKLKHQRRVSCTLETELIVQTKNVNENKQQIQALSSYAKRKDQEMEDMMQDPFIKCAIGFRK